MTQPVEDGNLPAHVLYRFYDAEDRLLYIGMTSAFQSRFSQHRSYTPWFSEVARYAKEYLPSRVALEAAEKCAIQTERAKYNIRHAPIPQEPLRHPERRFGRDANDFGRTDSIACDGIPPSDRENRIAELERYAREHPPVIDDHCPSCHSAYLIEHDQLVKCLYCFDSWTVDEFTQARLEEINP